MNVLAIDPGTTESGWCIVDADTLKPLEFGKWENEKLRDYIDDIGYAIAKDGCEVVIERLQSYGMPVGKETFVTAEWIGRFCESARRNIYLSEPGILYRKDEKLHICGSPKAKDGNIRNALIERFAQHDLKNGKGTKRNPDWFYGFRADIWAAYAVGLTYIETMLRKER